MTGSSTHSKIGSKSGFQDGSVDFSELVLGLSSAALHYMGEGHPGVGDGKPAGTNMVLARQNIEIIRMLKVKTHGNLTSEELHLIDGVLTDLMTKFHQVFSSTKNP